MLSSTGGVGGNHTWVEERQSPYHLGTLWFTHRHFFSSIFIAKQLDSSSGQQVTQTFPLPLNLNLSLFPLLYNLILPYSPHVDDTPPNAQVPTSWVQYNFKKVVRNILTHAQQVYECTRKIMCMCFPDNSIEMPLYWSIHNPISMWHAQCKHSHATATESVYKCLPLHACDKC